jgi:hypothetical protein
MSLFAGAGTSTVKGRFREPSGTVITIETEIVRSRTT